MFQKQNAVIQLITLIGFIVMELVKHLLAVYQHNLCVTLEMVTGKYAGTMSIVVLLVQNGVQQL